MKNYLQALEYIMLNGEVRKDRTGVGTVSCFGEINLTFDLQKHFPAVTTKKLAWNAVKSELIWFLEGSNDERRLAEILYGKDRNKLFGKETIWTGNARSSSWLPNSKFEGDLGDVYGVQWRNWKDKNGVIHDQIKTLIDGLKNNPHSRRHILSAWNVGDLDNMALPPCHILSQFYISEDNRLSCKMYQRSADFFLGVPFNIASYALLTHILAKIIKVNVGKLFISFGDAHIYLNHLDAVSTQLQRNPLMPCQLEIKSTINDINNLQMTDFNLIDYKYHDTIKAPMAV